jgi:hypothetical protein
MKGVRGVDWRGRFPPFPAPVSREFRRFPPLSATNLLCRIVFIVTKAV